MSPPFFILLSLGIGLALSCLGMMIFPKSPGMVATTIDLILVYVITPHIPMTAAEQARWATFPKSPNNDNMQQQTSATGQVLSWAGHNVSGLQWIVAALVLAVPFVLCYWLRSRQRGRSGIPEARRHR